MASRFAEESERLKEETTKFRDQLIVVSGGILTVFVAINGNAEVPTILKYGFGALGVSLLFGMLSIVLHIVHSFFVLAFFTVDEDLISFQKKIREVEKMIKTLKPKT